MKLINKDALVAEIERRKKNHAGFGCYPFSAYCLEDREILYFINTQEVKELDLEKEIEDHAIGMPMSEFTHDSEVEDFHEWVREEFKHFFELGLNASNPLTWEDIELIHNITYEESRNVSLNKGGEISEQEFYQEVLKRFKDKKGE